MGPRAKRVAVVACVVLGLAALALVPVIPSAVPGPMLRGGYLLLDRSGSTLGNFPQPDPGSLAANITADPRFVTETHGLNYTYAGSSFGGSSGVSEQVLIFYHYGNQLELRCNTLGKVITDGIYVTFTTTIPSYTDTLNSTSYSFGEPNMTITHGLPSDILHCPPSAMTVIKYPVTASLTFLLAGQGTVYSNGIGYILVP